MLDISYNILRQFLACQSNPRKLNGNGSWPLNCLRVECPERLFFECRIPNLYPREVILYYTSVNLQDIVSSLGDVSHRFRLVKFLTLSVVALLWLLMEIKIVACATVPAWADCHMANNSTPPGVILSIPYVIVGGTAVRFRLSSSPSRDRVIQRYRHTMSFFHRWRASGSQRGIGLVSFNEALNSQLLNVHHVILSGIPAGILSGIIS